MSYRQPILRTLHRADFGLCRRRNPFRRHAPPVSAFVPSRARNYSTKNESAEEQRAKSVIGPYTYRAAIVFVGTGAALYWYFESEKAKVQEQKRKELADSKVGKARVGGPFSLTTHTGEPYSDKDILGKWSLIYFGFTNCPDICPDELDKMTEVVKTTDQEFGPIVQPIFISCDPARDSVEQMRDYISDFHPRMIGLTGTYDAVKATCKAYRVYFSTPPNTKPGDDYLVDHSIFFYLMDPKGEFVDAFGKSSSADDVRQKVRKALHDWKSAS